MIVIIVLWIFWDVLLVSLKLNLKLSRRGARGGGYSTRMYFYNIVETTTNTSIQRETLAAELEIWLCCCVNCHRRHTQWPLSDPWAWRVRKRRQERPEEHRSHALRALRWRRHAQSMTHVYTSPSVPYHPCMTHDACDVPSILSTRSFDSPVMSREMKSLFPFLFLGLHQFGQRGAEQQWIPLLRPLPQQQPSLERDGEAAHPHRSLQRVPPTLRVPTLLQWVSHAAQWQASLSTLGLLGQTGSRSEPCERGVRGDDAWYYDVLSFSQRQRGEETVWFCLHASDEGRWDHAVRWEPWAVCVQGMSRLHTHAHTHTHTHTLALGVWDEHTFWFAFIFDLCVFRFSIKKDDGRLRWWGGVSVGDSFITCFQSLVRFWQRDEMCVFFFLLSIIKSCSCCVITDQPSMV